MKNNFKILIWFIFLFPSTLFAWKWVDLWQTADQQGAKLLQAGKAQEASHTFKNKAWETVAIYRSGNYTQAFQQFGAKNTSDGQYNAGNAAAFIGKYQQAITSYDKAIALNPNNKDAITNRDIIKKLLNKKNQQQNKSSANSAKNNNNKNSSSAQQKMSQNNQPPKDSNGKEKENPQKTSGNSSGQAADKQPLDTKNQPVQANSSKPQDESKKQLLRRLAEDPGGLLKQKFVRDYFRRHNVVENSDQGDD